MTGDRTMRRNNFYAMQTATPFALSVRTTRTDARLVPIPSESSFADDAREHLFLQASAKRKTVKPIKSESAFARLLHVMLKAGESTVEFKTRIFPLVRDQKRRGAHYCGPSAAALLTGVPAERIEQLIRRKRGGYRDTNGRRIPVRGTYPGEIVRLLKRLGCKVEKRAITVDTWTLGQFVRDVEHMGTFLVEVTGHFMVCERGRVFDNGHPAGMGIDAYPKARRRMCAAWRVVAPLMPKYTLDTMLAAEAAKPPKPPRDLKVERRGKVEADIKRWQRKEKLAKTKLRKLRARLRYYERASGSAEVAA
jgi:hypothetical protein